MAHLPCFLIYKWEGWDYLLWHSVIMWSALRSLRGSESVAGFPLPSLFLTESLTVQRPISGALFQVRYVKLPKSATHDRSKANKRLGLSASACMKKVTDLLRHVNQGSLRKAGGSPSPRRPQGRDPSQCHVSQSPPATQSSPEDWPPFQYPFSQISHSK